MKVTKLNFHGFIDPKWYRSVLGKPVVLVVSENQTVELEGVILHDACYPTGTRIRVTVGRNIEAVTMDEYSVFRAQQVHTNITESIEDFRKEKFLHLAIEENNHELFFLPFQWSAARLDVLSGLTENSLGTGNKANTAYHIMLQEDFQNGRLMRKAKSHLCGADVKAKNWSGTNSGPQEYLTFDMKNHPYQITCRRCLRIAHGLLKRMPPAVMAPRICCGAV